jgi:hypothetical protein
MSVDLSKLAPGVWILTSHWQGPWAEVAKVTAKRVFLKPRGVIEPSDVRAIHPTKEAAMAAHTRYQQALAAGTAAIEPLKEEARLARERFDAAKADVRAKAWAAAQGPSHE